MKSLPTGGLLPKARWKIHSASSENISNQKHARQAIDGDPHTIWHSQFRPDIKSHPHELIIDMGESVEFNVVAYLARQDQSWNGALAVAEFSVSDDPKTFSSPPFQAHFKKTREAQTVACGPHKGRFLRVRSISEVGNGPWATIAEIGVYQHAVQ